MDVTNWNNRNRIFRKSRPDPIDEYLVNVGRKIEVFDVAGVESLPVFEIIGNPGVFDGDDVGVITFSLDVPESIFTLVGKHVLLAHFVMVFSGMRIKDNRRKEFAVFVPIFPPWLDFVGSWSMTDISFPGNIARSMTAGDIDVEWGNWFHMVDLSCLGIDGKIWILCAFVFAGLD